MANVWIDYDEFHEILSAGGYAGTRVLSDETVLLLMSVLSAFNGRNVFLRKNGAIDSSERDAIDALIARAQRELSTGGGSVFEGFAVLIETYADGQEPAYTAANAWQDRTGLIQAGSFGLDFQDMGGGVMRVPAGTYLIEGQVVASAVNRWRAALYDDTLAFRFMYGSSARSANGVPNPSFFRDVWEFLTETDIRLQMWGSNTGGFGFASGGDGVPELYTQLRFTKLGIAMP